MCTVANCCLLLLNTKANVLTIAVKNRRLSETLVTLPRRMKTQTKSCYFSLENPIPPVEG